MPETTTAVDQPSFRVWAPGRVNLIGEHTDYSGGLVLPMAIQYGIRLAAVRAEREITLESEGYGRAETVAADGSGPRARGWARYAQAVAAELADAGRPAIGMTGTIASDLPPRAGLSSSAALEVALALALCAVADFELEPLELALALPARGATGGRRSMRHPRPGGVPARIGRSTRSCSTAHSLEHRRIHVPSDAGLLIVDSGVARSLENTAYAERRGELEQALRLVGAARSTEVETGALGGLDDVSTRRLRHVVTENERVSRFAAALEAGDLARRGGLLRESHASLRDDYEVSIPELDLLVELAIDAGALGARLLGGGFGGSVLVLAPAQRVEDVGRAIAARYRERAGTGGDTLLVRASHGATPSRPG